MIHARRPEIPAVLREREDAWGQEYEEKRAASPGHRFQWKTLEGKPVNQHLLPQLQRMTAHHCAYCDGFPLGPFARETIDHFRPKSRFPRDAYRWQNLFLACDVCQDAKGESFDAAVLKPDVDDYAFDRYFLFNVRTGEIEPNPAGTTQDEQERARKTIEWLGLNSHSRPQYRRTVYEYEYCADRRRDPETMPYRFLALLVTPATSDVGG